MTVQIGDQVRLPDGREGVVWSEAPGAGRQVWLVVDEAFTPAQAADLTVLGKAVR